MSARLLSLAPGLLLAASLASADVFVLGDVTPVFSLTEQFPHQGSWPGPSYTVKGNQDLFFRLAGEAPQPCVMIRVGEGFEYPGQYAVGELHNFYIYKNIRVDDISNLDSDTLVSADLLILINPDWQWEQRELLGVTELVARGGHLLLMVEPKLCSARCRESSDTLLQTLGTTLRIGDESGRGAPWGLLADHPFMRGIRPVTYGAAFTVQGGTALMYDGDALSVFSVDKLGSAQQIP